MPSGKRPWKKTFHPRFAASATRANYYRPPRRRWLAKRLRSASVAHIVSQLAARVGVGFWPLGPYLFATNGSSAECDQDADAAQGGQQQGRGFRNRGRAAAESPRPERKRRSRRPMPNRTIEPNVPLSTASRPEPDSTSGEVPLDDQTDDDGSAARTRSSNRLTSKPGSVAARRSIAAMRFSSCWPFALLIEPEAIAA